MLWVGEEPGDIDPNFPCTYDNDVHTFMVTVLERKITDAAKKSKIILIFLKILSDRDSAVRANENS